MMDAETMLRACRLFARLAESSRALLLAMAQRRQFPAGSLIFRQGDPCPGRFVVGSGLVRIFVLAPSGKQQILHRVSPGDTFAEVATIGRFDCPAFAEAAADTVCLLLPCAAFQEALRQDHALCLQLLEGMVGRVHHFLGLVEDITLRNAAGRVARFMLESVGEPDDLVRWPGLKKDLANQLNLSGETFSRTLRRLSEAGLIVAEDGPTLKILSRSGLQEVCDGLFPNL